MKQSKVLLINMVDIVAICIMLYNLCIVNNKENKDKCYKIENKLARRVCEGETQNGGKLRGCIYEFIETERNI